MNVMDDLRMPDVENLVDGELRLDLRERVPVAIVIMTSVLVIKLRRIGAFVRRAQRLVVPVLDDVHPVRIRGRHQQDDCVAQNLLNLWLVRRSQTISNQHAGKIRADFRRMNAAGDRYDRLAAGNQRARFAIGERWISRRTQKTRVGELSLNLLEFIESLKILGGADRSVNKRRAHRRLANLFKLHPVTGSIESLKVFNDLG